MRRILPALAFALVLAPLPTLAQDGSFQTPSGNIHCYGGEDFVDCEIIESDARPPQKRPADCDLEWGNRFSVGDVGPGVMVCYGDTLRGSGAVLAYGRSATFGAISCQSSESGLDCVNRDGGGFHLARRGQQVF